MNKLNIKNKKFLSVFSLTTNLGFIIVTPMIIFTLIGVWLDKLLSLKPIITVAGVLVGVTLGILAAYQQLKKIKW